MLRKLVSTDTDFPINLKPLGLVNELYVYGSLLPSDEKSLAVVGSRAMSEYGKNVVLSLVGDLVKDGWTIISGLAEGIDSEAHNLAVKLGGRTIGVLGYGFSFLRSSSQFDTAKSVIKSGGTLISPFHLLQRPTRDTFINRNKIIAGLAKGVLVIEATEKSGTFHTVNGALNIGRPVYAVPGNIFSYSSRGVHAMIKDGAMLVESAQDIFENS
jgi:DNA processing protein